MAGMVNGVEVFLPLKGLIDVDKETARLTKELEKLDKEISRLAKKLGNEGFLAKAPADVVAAEKERAERLNELIRKIEEQLAAMG
jgi:valyl-tRNA synthetase